MIESTWDTPRLTTSDLIRRGAMVGIQFPSEEQLPPGPRRDLMTELRELYTGAGRPGVRDLSQIIKGNNDLPGTLSHEGVSSTLRCATIPRWQNFKSLVLALLARQERGTKYDMDQDTAIKIFHDLWSLAGDESGCRSRDVRPGFAAAPASSSIEIFPRTAQGKENPQTGGNSYERLARLNMKHGSLDIFQAELVPIVMKVLRDWEEDDGQR